VTAGAAARGVDGAPKPAPAVTEAGRLSFRPLRRDDFGLLGTWLDREHVARWWRDPHDPATLEAHYGPAIDGSDPTAMSVVLAAGRPVGLVQHYRVQDHAAWSRTLRSAGFGEPSAGIDYLIGEPDLIGIGLGPRIITALVDDVWATYPELARITVAVQQENRRSWRALEKSGFRRVFAGMIDSDDPGDAGPSYLYVMDRPGRAGAGATNDG
jgi:aminoglycoside 6'-N-acetyltransferase